MTSDLIEEREMFQIKAVEKIKTHLKIMAFMV